MKTAAQYKNNSAWGLLGQNPDLFNNAPHGMAKRNTALVQLMLQTGLRVGEVAALGYGDIYLAARSGWVQVRTGKGLKSRQIPLNVTARRTLRDYLDTQETISDAVGHGE